MKVLDLFAGLKGWSVAFKERGHQVTTLEIDQRFNPTICKNILEVKSIAELGQFDIILASPPCTAFSIAAAWKYHWWKDPKGVYHPQTPDAVEALEIACHTFNLLEQSNAPFWVIENPRGFMRKVFTDFKIATSFAAYQSSDERGATISAFHDKRKPSLKATDLWGKIPPSFVVKQASKDAIATIPKDKHRLHGIRDPALRAKIPYGLSLEMCMATEKDLGIITNSSNTKGD